MIKYVLLGYISLLLWSCYDFKNLIYVDENGNDITGDGSLLNPYQSAQQGLKVLENGDTLMLSGHIKGQCEIPEDLTRFNIRGEDPKSTTLTCCLYSLQPTTANPLRLRVENLTFNDTNVVYIHRPISILHFSNVNLLYADDMEMNTYPFLSISDIEGKSTIFFEDTNIVVNLDKWYHSEIISLNVLEGTINFRQTNFEVFGLDSKQPPIEFVSETINLEKVNINSTAVMWFRADEKIALLETTVVANRFLLDGEQVFLFDNEFQNNLNREHYLEDQLVLLEVDLTCNDILCDSTYIIASGNIFKEYGMQLAVDNYTDLSLSYISYSDFEMGNTSYAIRVQPVPSSYIPDPIIAHFNWYGHPSGPTICCNPKGEGASLSIHVDYSLWCLTRECNHSAILSPTESCMRDGCYMSLTNTSIISLVSIGSLFFIGYCIAVIVFRIMVLKKISNPTRRLFRLTLISCIGVMLVLVMAILCIITLGITECKPRDQNVCLNPLSRIALWCCLLPLAYHIIVTSLGIYISIRQSGQKQKYLRIFNILCLTTVIFDVIAILFVTGTFFTQYTPPILSTPIAVVILSGAAQTTTLVFTYRLYELVEDKGSLIAKQLIVKKRWSLQSELKENKSLEKKARKNRILLIVLDILCIVCLTVACLDTFLVANSQRYQHERPNPISIRYMSYIHLGIYILLFFHAILGHVANELYYITTLLLTYFFIGIALLTAAIVLVIIWLISIIRVQYEYVPVIVDSCWIIGCIIVLIHVWKFRQSIQKNLAKTIMTNVNKRIDDLMFSNGEEMDSQNDILSDSQLSDFQEAAGFIR